jgi:hypothetical protein
MKAKYLYIILFIFSLFIQYGCERELTSEGVSRVTTYAVVNLNGDYPMFLEVGEAYNEPGASTETGDPVTISGTVDPNTPGVYDVNYSATNVDGFVNTVTRTVYVSNTGDLVSSIEGLYTCTVERIDPAEIHEGIQFVRIWKTGDNTYELSDALGGFYANGRGYGSAYAGIGATITANDIPSNDFLFTDAYVPGWGDYATITDLTVDPETKTIVITTEYVVYVFVSTLVQYEF